MAGVSTKEIKNRIRSMESTRQITKAMEMVASSKLRKAQAQALAARPYFETLRATIASIAAHNRDLSSGYLQKRNGNRTLCLVIAGDRGLAGGYNSNVLKAAMEVMEGKEAQVLPIGKKAVDYFRAHNLPALTESYQEAALVSIGDCFSIARQLCKGYLSGDFDRIEIAYTKFVSVLSQVPDVITLLPLTPGESRQEGLSSDILYEPSAEEVFDTIIPEYLGGVIYGCLRESQAAEHAARRTAMDSATSNAEDMIADLSLKFNRARQAAITQEITEIVAGS